jgi:hypothetical protein
LLMYLISKAKISIKNKFKAGKHSM